MTSLKRLCAALALGAFALAGCGRDEDKVESAFDGYVADVTRAIVEDSPELASEAGLNAATAGATFTARLDDHGALAVERRRTAALLRDTQIRGFDPEALDRDENVTFDVLRDDFQRAAAAASFSYGRFDPSEGLQPYALNPLTSAFITLPDLFARRTPVANPEQAHFYVERLAQVGPAIDAETARARADAEAGAAPPDFVLDRTIAALDLLSGTPAEALPYVATFRRKLEALVGPLEPSAAEGPGAPPKRELAGARELYRQALQITQEKIQPAHARAAVLLRALRARAVADPGVGRLPKGDAFYRAALGLETSSDLDAERLHRIGQQRVAALSAELDGALRVLGLTEGPVGQRLQQLLADPARQYPDSPEGRAALLADTRARIRNAATLAQRYFGARPKTKLEILTATNADPLSPEPIAYEPPGLQAPRAALYVIETTDLSRLTRFDQPTRDFGETVPGRHVQVAFAVEQTALPLYRRLIGSRAFSDGWSAYAEQLMDEINIYEDDPAARLGYLRRALWRAARLVADTGIHAKGWSRDQAMAYLQQTTGDRPSILAAEIDRIAILPGRACAGEIGRQEILRLREQAKRGLGRKFTLARFHDTVLLNGATPLPALEALVDRWIAEEQ